MYDPCPAGFTCSTALSCAPSQTINKACASGADCGHNEACACSTASGSPALTCQSLPKFSYAPSTSAYLYYLPVIPQCNTSLADRQSCSGLYSLSDANIPQQCLDYFATIYCCEICYYFSYLNQLKGKASMVNPNPGEYNEDIDYEIVQFGTLYSLSCNPSFTFTKKNIVDLCCQFIWWDCLSKKYMSYHYLWQCSHNYISRCHNRCNKERHIERRICESGRGRRWLRLVWQSTHNLHSRSCFGRFNRSICKFWIVCYLSGKVSSLFCPPE